MWLLKAGAVVFAAITLAPVSAAGILAMWPEGRLSPAFPYAKLATNLILGILFVMWVSRATQLFGRLPAKLPGRSLFAWGLGLFVGVPLLLTLDGMYFNTTFGDFMSRNSLATYPGYLCLLLGCGQLLLNAKPRDA